MFISYSGQFNQNNLKIKQNLQPVKKTPRGFPRSVFNCCVISLFKNDI